MNRFYDKLGEVVLKPKYWSLTNPVAGLWYKLKKGSIQLLKSFFERIGEFDFNVDQLEGMGTIVAVIAALTLFAIVIGLIILVVGLFSKEERIKKILGETIGEGTTAQSILNQSLIYKSEGNYNESIRLSFIALLLHLNDTRVIKLREPWTNKEITLAVESSGFKEKTDFNTLALAFNHWHYSADIATEKDQLIWDGTFDRVWEDIQNG